MTDITQVSDGTTLPGFDPNGTQGYARLQTWDVASGYTTYEWAGATVADSWEWPEAYNVWLTLKGEDIATVDLPSGEGCWLWLDPSHVTDNISFTLSGEVPSVTSITNTLVSGYNLIANPYPVEIGIQDIEFVNLPGFDPNGTQGHARLQTWDVASGYTTYEWAGTTVAEPWEWPEAYNVWLTLKGEDIATNVKISLGEAFWLWLDPSQNVTGAKVIFSR